MVSEFVFCRVSGGEEDYSFYLRRWSMNVLDRLL
jgi:hypothetical protein